MKIGSLCTGYGGLDMALDGSTAWVSDIDKAACTLLAYRFPDVPNLGDLTAIDWSSVEPVDIITAGYPCQPFSHAGKREGQNDERHIWPHIANAIRVLRPRFVFLENVAGHLSLGFGDVLGQLAEAGYDAEWTSFRASDVGACHRRERIFILATDTRCGVWRKDDPRDRIAERQDGLQAGRNEGTSWTVGNYPTTPNTERDCGERWGGPSDVVGAQGKGESERDQRERDGHTASDSRATPAHATGDRWDEGRTEPAGQQGRSHAPVGGGQAPTNPRGEEQREPADGGLRPESGGRDWGVYTPAITRWEGVTGRPAPHPTTVNESGRTVLAPAFVEWMMGLPAGWVTDVPGISRTGQLHLLGNGVVPQQARAALAVMA